MKNIINYLIITIIAVFLIACDKPAVDEIITCEGDNFSENADYLDVDWSWHTEIYESSEAYYGAPVWADDDSTAAGIELKYQRRVSFPPLQGIWAKANHRFRVFTQDPDGGEKKYITKYIKGVPSGIFYMKSAGYYIVKRHIESSRYSDHLRIGEDGRCQAFAQNQPEYDIVYKNIVPSPDGSLLSKVACLVDRGVIINDADGNKIITLESLDPQPCKINFLNPDTLEAESSEYNVMLKEEDLFTLPGKDKDKWYPIRDLWTKRNTLILTNWLSEAYELNIDMNPEAVSIPDCHGPVTTSSQMSSDGRRIGVKNNSIQIIQNISGIDNTFSCQ